MRPMTSSDPWLYELAPGPPEHGEGKCGEKCGE